MLLSFIGWWHKLKKGRKANFSMVALKFAALEVLSAGYIGRESMDPWRVAVGPAGLLEPGWRLSCHGYLARSVKL